MPSYIMGTPMPTELQKKDIKIAKLKGEIIAYKKEIASCHKSLNKWEEACTCEICKELEDDTE